MTALGAEMPKEFQGKWCCNHVNITATEVKSPELSVSCVVRKVTKLDVCPWGMIFRNRERARVLRPFQINPWGPGYHIVLQCTGSSKVSETIGTDWVIEKENIRVGMPRDYRCPWDRRAPSPLTGPSWLDEDGWHSGRYPGPPPGLPPAWHFPG